MIDCLYNPFKKWSERGTVWLISDTHFGDLELREGIPNRPSDAELVDLINSKVGKHDTLVHLGDVGERTWVDELKGYKVLLLGNHDLGHTNYERYFNEVYGGPLMISDKIILSHEPLDIDWAYNIHGHDHAGQPRPGHLNVCVDVIGYTPVHFNQFVKSGALSKIKTIHRITTDKATRRAWERHIRGEK